MPVRRLLPDSQPCLFSEPLPVCSIETAICHCSSCFCPLQLFNFSGNIHIWVAFPYPSPVEAPIQRLSIPHGFNFPPIKKYSWGSSELLLAIPVSSNYWCSKTPWLLIVFAYAMMEQWCGIFNVSYNIFRKICECYSIEKNLNWFILWINKFRIAQLDPDNYFTAAICWQYYCIINV